MKTRKILAVVLAGLMALSMLAGCGGDDVVTTAELNEEVKNLEGYKASAEPLELTMHFQQGVNQWNPESDFAKDVFNATNISIKPIGGGAGVDEQTAFNTALMEDPLPDILGAWWDYLQGPAMDGALIPLEDYLEDYAPNAYKFFQENPDLLNGSKSYDGHLYYMPGFSFRGPSEAWFIRQDWLDKLGLEMPTTVDEYYNVLKAFREQDPNGNGKKDEIPYICRDRNPYDLLQLFGVAPTFDAIEDGKVYLPRTTPEFKEAIKEIAKWYKEGLIDPEIFTRQSAREQLFGNDLGGSTYDWFSSTLKFNQSLEDTVPHFNMVAMLPPKDKNGNAISWGARSIYSESGWGITKDNKHIAETMKFFDYFYSEEGRLAKSFGTKDVTYIINDEGKPEFTDLVKNYPGSTAEFMVEKGYYALSIGGIGMEDSEVAGMTQDAKDAYYLYKEKVELAEVLPPLAYTPEEQRTFSEIWPNLLTEMDTTIQSWVLGYEDVDAGWDAYIQRLNTLGLEKFVNNMQKVYDRQYK